MVSQSKRLFYVAAPKFMVNFLAESTADAGLMDSGQDLMKEVSNPFVHCDTKSLRPFK